MKPDLLSKCLPFLLLLFSGERISFPRDAIADRLFRVGGGECGAAEAGIRVTRVLPELFMRCVSDNLSIRCQVCGARR